MKWSVLGVSLLLAAAVACGEVEYSGGDGAVISRGDPGSDLPVENAGNSGEPPSDLDLDDLDRDDPDGPGSGGGGGGDGVAPDDPCAAVFAQSAYCLGAAEDGRLLLWIGLDDGLLCPASALEMGSAQQVPGQSLMLVDDVVYLCAADQDGDAVLVAHNLPTGKTEMSRPGCTALMEDPRGGYLATPSYLTSDSLEGGVYSFATVEAVQMDDPTAWTQGDILAGSALAASGEWLYGADLGPELTIYELETGRAIRELRLERQAGWVFGIAALGLDRIVATGPGRIGGLTVHDVRTGQLLSDWDLDVGIMGVQCFE